MFINGCRKVLPCITVGTAIPGAASRNTLVAGRHTRLLKAKDEEGSDLGEMFKQELQKRNISSIDDIADRSIEVPSSGRNEPPPQLVTSRQLGSEGLEGLVPRATELLKLGVSFFLAFGPFIIGVSVAFLLVSVFFGDAFVHGGSPSSGQPTYDPAELLSEQTVDPMIPMQ